MEIQNLNTIEGWDICSCVKNLRLDCAFRSSPRASNSSEDLRFDAVNTDKHMTSPRKKHIALIRYPTYLFLQ